MMLLAAAANVEFDENEERKKEDKNSFIFFLIKLGLLLKLVTN